MRAIHLLLALALLLPPTLLPGTARAAGPARHAAIHFALGTAAAACTVIYGTGKVLYAVLGSATGALAWVLTGGNGEIARTITQSAIRGDYVVTPEHLTSDMPLVFVGRDPYRR
ncbi:MAG: hypothetical protein V3T14_08410 [Myxococcota bacterium]